LNRLPFLGTAEGGGPVFAGMACPPDYKHRQPDVAELIAATAAEAVPPGVVREIHRVTDGSPLFVQEIVRHKHRRATSPSTSS
jgi:hypothetical protein